MRITSRDKTLRPFHQICRPSSLPSDSRSYFYYSGSAALGYTDLLKLDSKVLTLGKLRASYARVGKGTNPYEIALGYDSGGLNNGNGSLGDSHLGQPFATQQDNLPPVNLKPQITRSLEFGSEMRFFGDRAGLDVTVYRTNTYNQITSIPDQITSIMDQLTSIPDQLTSLPDHISSIPDHLTSLPDRLTSRLDRIFLTFRATYLMSGASGGGLEPPVSSKNTGERSPSPVAPGVR